jgi:hypothetical protein
MTMQPDPNAAATHALSEALYHTHILDGLIRRGAAPTLPQYPEMTPHMLRRLADQIEEMMPSKRRAA